MQVELLQENLECPHCHTPHYDIDEWALKPHRTHLCLSCGELFEGSVKGVSRPTFQELQKPENVIYKDKD
jgi:predicted CXXCH cytochrome family protein